MTISDLVPWKKKRQDLAADQGEKDLLPDLRIQMNRLFDEFFERPFGLSSMFYDSPLERDFAPLLDISETDKEITVTAELPGLELDEIDLTFNQGSLTISGEKHAEQEQEGETYYRIERSYGSFQRTVALPPDVVVVVEEAYIEFVRDAECLQSKNYWGGERPVVTLRTFSKLYGLAGLRVGYGVMPVDLAGYLNRIRQPFNVNALAQAAARAALRDHAFVSRTLEIIHEGLAFMYAALTDMGLTYFPTQSNFFLIDLDRDAETVFQAMLRRGVIVRSMKGYGYPTYMRVNVGTPEENQHFIDALKAVMG